jgi:membrane protein YfhO
LFPNWQSTTNDEATLNQLADPSFDPLRTVLVSGDVPPATPSGTSNGPVKAEYVSYSTKDIQLRANAEAPSVLLLNDRYDAEWQVSVDDKPAKLLRCNYMMRGVQVPPGQHTIHFHYAPALHGLRSTLASFALGILLCISLFFLPKERRTGEKTPA